MKKVFVLFVFLFAVISLAACDFSDLKPGNNNVKPDDSGETPDGPGTNPDDPGTNPVDPGTNPGGNEHQDDKYLTVTQAYEMASSAGSDGTSEKQYVYGTVKSISNANYGEMYITDGTTDLYIYGVYSSDGTLKYSEMTEKPYSGDVVYLYGILKTFNNSPEMGAAWLQKYEPNQTEIDLSEYTEVSILGARSAETGSKLIVEGVVAKITYANGMNPNGAYLVDDTGSIYVYGLEVAGRIKEGQKAKIAGIKTLYILESEQGYAAEHGYQGSIQLQDTKFISSTEETYDFDKSWIQESTVKKMLDTPMSDNITTNIYKVNALIKEAPGVGFTNYYIDDLDGETGSYCYSLCNGKDYEYLKEFDGKICEVYLSALNCKATKAATIYRFVPIAVKEISDFKMSDADIANFALEYYAAKQFLNEYNSDPALVLKSSFSNELIPFSNVSVEYSTDNPDLVGFNNVDGDVVMHTNKGNAKVNIIMSATYKEAKASMNVEIFVNYKDLPDTISIKDATKKPDGTEVVVKGIIMSGTTNQTGFYLNDGTGVIAVTTSEDIISTLSLGNEVVIKGIKDHKTSKPDTMVGQIYIHDATVEVNLLGNNEYSKETFITDKSFDEVKTLINDLMVDQTTNVFVTKCYISRIEGAHSTNYYLSSTVGGKDIYLYAGSGAQYDIYLSFVDKEVEVTFTLVNWNSKTPYRACIISATDGEKTIVNNYKFN